MYQFTIRIWYCTVYKVTSTNDAHLIQHTQTEKPQLFIGTKPIQIVTKWYKKKLP